MALTASTHIVIPSLIGRGLTEHAARTTLAKARMLGYDTAQVAGQTIPVSYANGKYTIEEPR